MTNIGQAAKYLRNRLGLSQRAAAKELQISHVHLSKIENGETSPTASMIERYYDTWGIDLYMLAVSKFSDGDRIPTSLAAATDALRDAWELEIESLIDARIQEGKTNAEDTTRRITC